LAGDQGRSLPLAQATADGVAAEPRNASQSADRPTSFFACQETDKKPASPLVESGEQSVDVSVGASGGPPGVQQALGAAAPRGSQNRSHIGHGDAPLASWFAV